VREHPAPALARWKWPLVILWLGLVGVLAAGPRLLHGDAPTVVPVPVAPVAAEDLPRIEPRPGIAPPVDARALLATGFDIVVKPASARITLDGALVGEGPLRVRNLVPGPHTIHVARPGHRERTVRLDLRRGQAEFVHVVLEPADD
jgi:hypothetical protein